MATCGTCSESGLNEPTAKGQSWGKMNINSLLDDVQASLLIWVGVKWYHGYVLDREKRPLIYIYIWNLYMSLYYLHIHI